MKRFLLFNAIALFLCLFVVIVLSVPYLFSKISPYSSLGFYSVIEEDFKSNLNANDGKELLKSEKVADTFTASENNIGIILVRFFNFNKISSDSVVFRLKEEGQKGWYYEYSYKVDQFQPNQYFTFGFPEISNSINKKYLFELESFSGREGNAIGISKKSPVVAYVYQYSKTKIFEDKKTLLRFSIKKAKYAIHNIDKNKLIFSYLLFLSTIFILYEVVIKRGKGIRSFIGKRSKKYWNLTKSVNLKPFVARIKKIFNYLHALYLFVKKSRLLKFVNTFISKTLMTENNKRIFPFILLGIAVLFSLGKTLQYYFFTDDYSLLYHLQQNITETWPYHHVTMIYKPFYNMFGINPKPYFLLGIITYFTASLTVYFFIKTLIKVNLIAIFSSLIFATGYIGLDQFTMMTVSIINNLNILNVGLTLVFLIWWLESKKLRFYLITLLMFWLSITLFPFRAFPLLIFLPTIELFLSIRAEHLYKIFKKLIFIFLRYLPFLFIAYHYGPLSYGFYERGGTVVPQYSNGNILSLFTPDSIKELFAILGRFVFLEPLIKLLGLLPSEIPYFQIGFIFFFGITLISLSFFISKNLSRLGRSLLVVLFLTIEGYIGNLILLPSFDSNGAVNRYLTTALLGYSAIFPIISYFIYKKIITVSKIRQFGFLVFIPALIIILTMVSLSRNFEENILRERSYPAREFFKQLKDYLPSISRKNVFYFDRADYYPVASRFGSIILGAFMPKEATLAVFYSVPLETIKIVDDFDALITLLKTKDVDINNIHTFYYDEKGLYQTTDRILSLLEKGEIRKISVNQVEYGSEYTNPQLEASRLNIPSFTPMIINVSLKITSFNQSVFNFPFYNLKKEDENKKNQIKEFYNKLNKNLIFSYLSSRKEYYDNVKVEVSSSHWAYREKFLIDDKEETSWLAGNSGRGVDIKPWIKIDLGEKREISRLLFKQETNRIPSDYKILTSEDGIVWNQVKIILVNNSLLDDNLIINNFDSVLARYVMLKIIDTENGFTPGLSEIEVIEDKYREVDTSTALRIKENPFEFIIDRKDLEETYNYLCQTAFLKILTKTNKDENILNSYVLRVPIKLDGKYHDYKIQLPPRGTSLEKIKIELNFPAKMELERMEIFYPPLKNL